MIWDRENHLLLRLQGIFGLIFQNNACDLLCITVKFTDIFTLNKGSNAVHVLDFNNCE